LQRLRAEPNSLFAIERHQSACLADNGQGLTMRLKAEFWAHGYIRICANANCPAFVVRHGDDDAGAVFVKINHLDGTASLYGPAPTGFSEVSRERRFVAVMEPPDMPERDVDAHLAQQFEFDSDMWLIEVEDAKRRHFLDDWLMSD